MILAALFSRPVRRKPLRFLATVLGVAAGVAAVVATLSSSRAALSALREGVIELSGRSAIEVTRPGGVDEGELTLLAPLATDAWITPVVDKLALCQQLGDTVRLFGIDPLVDARVRDLGPTLAAGFLERAPESAFLELLEGRGAFISESLARELALSIGGTIALDVAAKPVQLRILATFPSADTAILDRLVVVDVALAETLVGKVGTLDRIELVPRHGVDAGRLRERAEQLVSSGVVVGVPADRVARSSGIVRSLEFNLTALSSISLIVGAVLVATTLATSIVQRRRTIALLYSIGASRGQVMRAVLFEALAIGVLGSALGVALGFAGAGLMVDGMRQTLATVVSSTKPGTIRFGLDHAAFGFALGLAASLLSSLLPVIEGSRTPPIQALRGETPNFLAPRARRIAIALAIALLLIAVELAQLPAYHGLPIMALGSSLAILAALFTIFGPIVDVIGRVASARFGLPIGMRLACAGLSAGRRRAAWAAGAVGLAVALSIAIATLVISFRTTVVHWTESTMKADLAVRPPAARSGVPVGKLDRALVELVRATIDPRSVDPYYACPATFQGLAITLGGTHFEVAAQRGGGSMLDGSDAQAALTRAWKQHEVMVNEAGAQRFGWKTGDVVQVQARGITLERRIAGVFRDYSDSQGVVVVDESDFRACFPKEGPNYIDVYCADPADVPAVRAALDRAIHPQFAAEILDNRALRANVLSMFERTFEITQALSFSAAIVAVIAALSVLFALVSERSRDLALLAAIGASAGQVRTVVCVQAGLLGSIGALCGALAGMLIGFVLVRVVNLQSFGWTLEFERPYAAFLSTSALVALACVVAGLLPARAAAVTRMRGALREEG